jgi:leucyl aminopeptidase (aminopeptidase T)
MADVAYELSSAAERVIGGALAAVPGERLVIITDRERAALGEALAEAARWAKVKTESFSLDDYGPEPLAELPAPIVQALAIAQASVYVARASAGEVGLRRRLVELVAKHGLRHAHMLGVTARVMTVGLAVDPHRIADTARALRARLRPSSSVHVKSAAGSDLWLTCNPAHRWVENSGIIRPGRWLNLPAGELLTVPANVEGTFVCDAAMTALPGAEPAPVTLRIAQGRVTSVSSRTPAVARAVESFLRSGSFNDRVGLMSFGTNIGLSEPTGSLIADQTLPGLHLALGMTLPELTGASWDASGQLVLTAARADIDVDGAPVLRAGRYLI